MDTVTLSADAPVGNEFTLVGATILQEFTDNNAKHGGLVKLIYTPSRVEGLSSALVFKQLRSDQSGTGYFSPDRQQLIYLDSAYSTAIFNDRFVFKSSLGLGEEVINNDIRNNFVKVELALRGWFDDVNALDGRLGCSNSGDGISNRNASHYRYCYAMLNYRHALE